MEFVLRRKILCTIQGNDPGTETGASGRVGARNNRIDGHPRGHQVKIEILAGAWVVKWRKGSGSEGPNRAIPLRNAVGQQPRCAVGKGYRKSAHRRVGASDLNGFGQRVERSKSA